MIITKRFLNLLNIEIDELNSWLGLIRCMSYNMDLLSKKPTRQHEEVLIETGLFFKQLQNDLFDIRHILGDNIKDKQITEKRLKFLTEKINKYRKIVDDSIGDLSITYPIIPGTGMLNSYINIAKSISERLKIRMTEIKKDSRNKNVFKYINLLCEYLFIYSRWVTVKLEEKEFLWE